MSRPKGRAYVNPSSPHAFAVCDACGFLYNLNQLSTQHEWNGVRLQDSGFLVCSDCMDKPNPGLRAINIPPDPRPQRNPRPERYDIDLYDTMVTQDDEDLTTQDDENYITQNSPDDDA